MSALAERSVAETVCEHCGARLAADQDWCLECGDPARVRVRAAPDWRVPVAIVTGVVVVAAAGLVFALVALSNSANSSVSSTPAAATTTPATRAATKTPATGAPTTQTAPVATSPATPATTTPTTITSWPAGVTGFTVILGVIPGKAAATTSATKFAAAGIPVGVLNSSDYSSMRPGDWIVFSGTYTTKTQADTAATALQAKGQPGAYAFSVVPAP